MKHEYHERHGRHSGRGQFGNRADGSLEGHMRHRHGGRGGGGHGGHGGGKRFFERGQFKFALLELLAGEPMHGYQLIKAMEEKTGGLYTPSAGSVYPNLQLLEDMNLIGSSEAGGKKLYRITEEGLATLRERASTQEDAAQPGEHWGRHGRHHRHHHHGGMHGRHGKGGKHELRSLMKEWPDVVLLMARASGAAQAMPDSEHAGQFRARMNQLESELRDMLESFPDADISAVSNPKTADDEDQGSGRTEK